VTNFYDGNNEEESHEGDRARRCRRPLMSVVVMLPPLTTLAVRALGSNELKVGVIDHRHADPDQVDYACYG
jgi:hypothetical protein